MKTITVTLAALLLLGVAACNESTTNPTDNPASETMAFKQGAKYEYQTYRTDPNDPGTGTKLDTSEQKKVLTLVNSSASVYGRSGVAVYVDSVFSLAGIFSVSDSTFLQQQSGGNDIYRYASLAPELDFSSIGILDLDLGKDWRHEAKLGASSALWLVGEVADTFQIPSVPSTVKGIKVAVTDSAVSSATESITIGGTSYKTTKTTHSLTLSFTALIDIGLGTIPIQIPAVQTLSRTTWISTDLGAIVREEREGKIFHFGTLTVPGTGSGVEIPDIPVPGYVSIMTKVLATGA